MIPKATYTKIFKFLIEEAPKYEFLLKPSEYPYFNFFPQFITNIKDD